MEPNITGSAGDRTGVQKRYLDVRKKTTDLCDPLEPEDFIIQSQADVSPPKWHLAHTTWFFETFILKKYSENYREFDKQFGYLYNSYYETVGSFFPRSRRGLLSRPTHERIMEYREYVDGAMAVLLDKAENSDSRMIDFITEVGVNHEQQHQELLLMDLKENFFVNPAFYPYASGNKYQPDKPEEISWIHFDGGVQNIGFSGDSFSFDNETPEHKEYVGEFEIADRPVTNGEYLSFIEEGGYHKPELWLSNGLEEIRKNKISAPEYWVNRDGEWFEYKLTGLEPLNPDEPVCHVSYYEADAFARWSGFRLPTEAEWETAAVSLCKDMKGNFLDSGILHVSSQYSGKLKKMFGDTWEWTSSSYLPYHGFKPLKGSLGEYNGKFMSGQMVLRGGSFLTPSDHIRPTYRNFFAPEKRWAVTGIRLAGDKI